MVSILSIVIQCLILGFDSMKKLLQTGDRCRVRSFAKMSIDPKFVELTADAVRIIS